MKSKTNITYTIAVVLSVLLLLFTSLFESNKVVHAETSDGINYDSTYVMDDLKGTTVDGEVFNLYNYGFDSKKPLKIFSFVEYCYSFAASKQDNYGLYVYVYNPQGIQFVYNSVQNKIQFAVGESAASYEKYSLQFLNCSTEANYEGLFIKYKVVLSEARKKAILDTLNSTERVYQVSGIELLIQGELNARDYPATGITDENSKGALIYRYSGYSKGYGADPSANTLSVKSSEGDVLSLEVHHTSWRPEGTHADDMYTQDSINSVYFAVPKEFPEKYGYLSEVHAEWLNAVTSWGLVTGEKSAYDTLYPFVGQDIGSDREDIGISFYGGADISFSIANGNSYYQGGGYLAYNPRDTSFYSAKSKITQLNWLFYAGDGKNAADYTTVTSDTFCEWYSSEFSKIVGSNYGERLECKDGKIVYKALFDSVDDEIKDYHLSNDGELISIVSQKWTSTWWSKTGFKKDGVAQPTEGIEIIHEVVENDILSNEIEMSNWLYISTSDCADFKRFYEDNKTENNIYLLRFCKTDYKSCEVREFAYSTLNFFKREKTLNTNAYFFKQNVFLDFDIIDVTFDNGAIKTVIPVVSDPIDIFPEATPPPITIPDKDKDPIPLWKKILYAILAVVAICILLRVLSIFVPIFKPVWDFIVLVITAPFRFIKWIFTKKE